MDVEESFVGVSACPVAVAEIAVRRTAIIGKTTPSIAFSLGHLDAYPQPAADNAQNDTQDSCSDCEMDLEYELGRTLEDGTASAADSGVDIHGGIMYQIGDIVWCFLCGASSSLGNTSIYLRKKCTGKPANISMHRRRGRLRKRQHPTTCEKLGGDHKRVRFE